MRRAILLAALMVAAVLPAAAQAWPRVDGTWRVSFTPLNYNQPPETVTWKLRPMCEFAACSLIAHSSTGNKFRFRLDRETGIYRWHRGPGAVPTNPCMRRDGTIIVERVYFATMDTTLHVAATGDDGRPSVLKGTTRVLYTASGRARAHNCRAHNTDIDRVYAVRG